jgi:hypothetical protein
MEMRLGEGLIARDRGAMNALADAVGGRALLFDVVNGLVSLAAAAGVRNPAVPSRGKLH